MADNLDDSIELNLRFRIPQRMPSVVANEMIIQPIADGVLLSFFEVIPPLLPTNPTTEQMENIRQAGVVAECVSRVFVPNSKFEAFANAMASIIKTTEKVVKPSKKK